MSRISVLVFAFLPAVGAACGDSYNYAPVIQPVGDVVVAAGDTAAFTLFASDPDGDALTLGLEHSLAGAEFDAASGEFSWATSPNDAGSHFVVATATDDGSPPLADTILVRIEVRDPTRDNHPPVWYAVPAEGTAQVGVEFVAAFEAIDPDSDDLTYVADPLPDGMIVVQDVGHPRIGELHWTPTAGQEGEYSMVVFAIDSGHPSMSIGVFYRMTVAP